MYDGPITIAFLIASFVSSPLALASPRTWILQGDDNTKRILNESKVAKICRWASDDGKMEVKPYQYTRTALCVWQDQQGRAYEYFVDFGCRKGDGPADSSRQSCGGSQIAQSNLKSLECEPLKDQLKDHHGARKSIRRNVPPAANGDTSTTGSGAF
jgi:hypothetical protein